MRSIYELKPKFQALLRPIANLLFNVKITPNQVTVFTCVMSIIVSIIIGSLAHYPWIFIIYPIWLFIRMALNAIDGIIAKDHQLQSHLGTYLNELGDVISDACLILVFAAVSGVYLWLVILVVFLAFLTEFVGVLSIMNGGTRRYDGPMGKSDRAFVLSVIAIGIAFNLISAQWLNGLFIVVAILLTYTIINRINKNLKTIKG